MNQEHLARLVHMMYRLHDCPALDEYGTRIFGRTVHGTWKLFRHIARMAVPSNWRFCPSDERSGYPVVAVPTFEEFATFMLHEVTHGWCYFHKDQPYSFRYATGVDEEQVCWDVSKLVCKELGISYDEKSASQSHQFHLLTQAGDMEGLDRLMAELPAHHQLPTAQ